MCSAPYLVLVELTEKWTGERDDDTDNAKGIKHQEDNDEASEILLKAKLDPEDDEH